MLAITRVALFCVGLLAAAAVSAADFEDERRKLETAMAADIRTQAEKDRDDNRKPVETLEFFGLDDSMKVVELFPGSGWYTKLLAPVMAGTGEFYAAYGTGRVKERLQGKPGFESLKLLGENVKLGKNEGERFYYASDTDLGVDGMDLVLTFRNYHNFDVKSRAAINASVFNALKSGGIYGIVDHTRRHMQALDNENVRRVDPVVVIKEVQAAGFELVDFSDLHYRPDDELRYEVGRATVTGNTDRFTLKFRKP
jgi:predicted methyltransferase